MEVFKASDFNQRTSQKTLDAAIHAFQRYIELNPDDAGSYYNLGQAYLHKGEYQDSVDSFNKALEIQPNHTQAKTNLGVAQWKLERGFLSLAVVVMDSLLGRILKLIFGSIVVGLFSGLIIPLVINSFSSDGSFELSELLLTFLIIIIILVFFVRFLTHHLSRIIAIKPHIDFNFTQFKFLSIPGVLTRIIPMGGGLFGGSGNEPIWIFILLGIVDSLFWSIPLFSWLLIAELLDDDEE